MVDISREQYEFLCRIKKNGFLEFSKLSKKEKDMVNFLIGKKFINSQISSFQDIHGNLHTVPIPAYEIKLTENGLAQIYTFKSKFYDTKIAQILSIISLIISAIALLKP